MILQCSWIRPTTSSQPECDLAMVVLAPSAFNSSAQPFILLQRIRNCRLMYNSSLSTHLFKTLVNIFATTVGANIFNIRRQLVLSIIILNSINLSTTFDLCAIQYATTYRLYSSRNVTTNLALLCDMVSIGLITSL